MLHHQGLVKFKWELNEDDLKSQEAMKAGLLELATMQSRASVLARHLPTPLVPIQPRPERIVQLLGTGSKMKAKGRAPLVGPKSKRGKKTKVSSKIPSKINCAIEFHLKVRCIVAQFIINNLNLKCLFQVHQVTMQRISKMMSRISNTVTI